MSPSPAVLAPILAVSALVAAALLAYVLSPRGRRASLLAKMDRDVIWLMPAIYILGIAGFNLNAALSIILQTSSRHVKPIRILLTTIMSQVSVGGKKLYDAITGLYGDAEGHPLLARALRGLATMAEERGVLARQVRSTWNSLTATMKEQALEGASRVEAMSGVIFTAVIMLNMLALMVILVYPEEQGLVAALVVVGNLVMNMIIAGIVEKVFVVRVGLLFKERKLLAAVAAASALAALLALPVFYALTRRLDGAVFFSTSAATLTAGVMSLALSPLVPSPAAVVEEMKIFFSELEEAATSGENLLVSLSSLYRSKRIKALREFLDHYFIRRYTMPGVDFDEERVPEPYDKLNFILSTIDEVGASEHAFTMVKQFMADLVDALKELVGRVSIVALFNAMGLAASLFILEALLQYFYPVLATVPIPASAGGQSLANILSFLRSVKRTDTTAVRYTFATAYLLSSLFIVFSLSKVSYSGIMRSLRYLIPITLLIAGDVVAFNILHMRI